MNRFVAKMGLPSGAGLIYNIAQASSEKAWIGWSSINRRCSLKDGVDKAYAYEPDLSTQL